MKKKRLLILGAVIVGIAIIVVAAITQVSKGSEKSFEATVVETVTQADGEIRLIVERTTEIYSNPLNSLHISEDTELIGAGGKISIEDLQPGASVKVTLKDSFVEETPFYYPTVYEIKVIHA